MFKFTETSCCFLVKEFAIILDTVILETTSLAALTVAQSESCDVACFKFLDITSNNDAADVIHETSNLESNAYPDKLVIILK